MSLVEDLVSLLESPLPTTEPVTVLPRAAGFQTDLVYAEQWPGTDRPYLLREDLVYFDGFLGFTVRAGLRYDRASIPGWFQRQFPPSLFDYAAAPHDEAYRRSYDRRVADALFHMIARSGEQAGPIRARLALRGLQLFGWRSWLANRRERRATGG